jgi:hypothetical protein
MKPWQETAAALRDFDPANVAKGSFAPDRYVTGSRGMSASPQKRTFGQGPRL